jgi:hypothetical protein
MLQFPELVIISADDLSTDQLLRITDRDGHFEITVSLNVQGVKCKTPL